jgi:hypothetical protein
MSRKDRNRSKYNGDGTKKKGFALPNSGEGGLWAKWKQAMFVKTGRKKK